MTKKSRQNVSNNLISEGILQEIKSYRPLRLFIKKQKKKGNETNPFALRSKFLQLPTEKQTKYIQKAIDKYIQLLDEKSINEHVQVEGKLFENLLSKTEQKKYFESINAPTKPVNTAAAYYAEVKKQENDNNPKAWKLLSAEKKKHYIQKLNDAKNEYSAQTKNFSENLPEHLKVEYLSFINQAHHGSHVNDNNDENTNPVPIRQRRKSVQSLPENFQLTTNDNQQKLTRIQLDKLHKCKPDILYYEKKVSDDEKPTFINSTAKNAYIRSLFNQLSEKKRHKFILKSTKKWEEYLESNPTISEDQIPTLHLLLGKNDDIHYYFSSLGLPVRPPVSALYLYNNEKQQTNSLQNWTDLSQTTKDEYIKRSSKLKHEYHQKLIEFVEKTLPSDYMKLEFFRNVKYAAKDYDIAIKDQVNEKDDGQLKITQYLVQKQKMDSNVIDDFDRIKQELLSTNLTNEQKKLVEHLGKIMNKYIDETVGDNLLRKIAFSRSTHPFFHIIEYNNCYNGLF
ncbi:unnamed protein product [Rotaria sp. Silwood2]|nr:unnamed protein product [Rotaria sp. Silwood2]